MTTNRLAKSEAPSRRTPEEWVEHGNQMLAGIIATSKGDYLKRNDVRWVLRDGQPVLDWTVRPHIAAHPFKHPMDRRGEPMSAEDTQILNYCLEEAGATARYLPDGTRFTIGDQAAA